MSIKKLLTIDIDSKRIFGLDILRCFAILFVVFGHANLLLPASVAAVLDHFVLDGVSIFFVLSGFLIGGILIKLLEKNELTFKLVLDFWQRRWFRTLPNYFLILSVLCLLSLLFEPGFNILSTPRYFVFSQNLYRPHPLFFPEAWSLSIEEWFYLLLPTTILFAVFVLRFKLRKALPLTIFSIIIAVTAFRFFRYSHMQEVNLEIWDIYFRKQVLTRLDSLMYGVLGAYLTYYKNDLWLRHKVLLFATGLLLLVLPGFIAERQYGSIYWSVFSFSVNALATLSLLPYLGTVKTGSGRLYKAVTYISLVSYSMYLINFSIVMGWIINRLPLQGYGGLTQSVVSYGLFWILTIVFSILLYKYFELPTTKWRDKIK
jgi:peptidoglycan/LPS O-acetylase OafA/YrhL